MCFSLLHNSKPTVENLYLPFSYYCCAQLGKAAAETKNALYLWRGLLSLVGHSRNPLMPNTMQECGPTQDFLKLWLPSYQVWWRPIPSLSNITGIKDGGLVLYMWSLSEMNGQVETNSFLILTWITYSCYGFHGLY